MATTTALPPAKAPSNGGGTVLVGAPVGTSLKSSTVIWKDNSGAFRVVEGRNPKPKPLNPARYFGAAPETDRNDSRPQAWWCPETDTPQPGAPLFEGLLGQTHMIDLSGLIRKTRLPLGQVKLLAKCEFLSPGMSLNDRAAKLRIDRAETAGLLRPGMSVVTSDASDFGASCAMVCAMRGFPLVACVATNEVSERVDTLKSYGARLVVGGEFSPSAEAARLCQQNPTLFFNLDTFDSDSDDASYMTLGPEIWDQTNGSITHWVCHPGSALSGVSRFLKERTTAIKTVSAVPAEPVFEKLCDLKKSSEPSKPEDDECAISDQELLETSVRLCREEGIMAGAQSGLNVAAALQVAAQVDTPSIIVTALPDIGIKFLSTIYNPEWVRQNNLVNPPTLPIPGCIDLQCPECSSGGQCEKAKSVESNDMQPVKMRRQRSAPTNAAGGAGSTRYYRRYEDLIGTTPMIDLSHLIDQSQCQFPDQVKVLAKCEFFNPGFSLKDRIARNILDRAEAAGMLKPGMCVVAASSGNTGAATAMLCAMRGYSCIITTCPKCSKEKQDAIKAYGATLMVTGPGLSEDNPDHYMNVARRLTARNPSLFYDVDQYDTLANPEGHYLTLGPEIWEQSQCEVTHFICAGSTGGTISGVGRFLKERNPKIKVVLADPIGSVFTNYFLSGNVGKPGKYLVEGVGKGSIPGAMDFSLVDAVLPVTDADAFQTCSRLCREEGIWPGGSSGLNVFAALRLAETVEEPSTIVTVMPDLGMKYLTKIYNDEWLLSNKLQALPPVHVDGLAPASF